MFEEIENKELTIDAYKMDTNGELHPDLPPPLNTFRSGFNVVICGASNMGKTTLMLNLISKPPKMKNGKKIPQSFKKLFTNVFVISPSLHTLKNNVFEDLDDDKKSQDFTEEWLDNFYDRLETIKSEGEEVNEKHFTLLILDDISIALRKNRRLEQKFVKLLANRRHLGSGGVSVITLVQSYLMVSPQHRNNLSHFFSFKPKTPKERDNIFEDLIGQDKKKLLEFFKFVFRTKHDFLMIDFTLTGGSADYDYYRNFNKIVFNNEGIE